MKLIIKFLLVLLLLAPSYVFAQCSNPDECQNLINQYQDQVTKLRGQANTLSNQIAQFDAQIKLTALKITQTEEKITLLGGRIDQLEVSLDSLTKAFTSRAVETYKMSRSGNDLIFLLASSGLTDIVSRFHYLQIIQKADGSLLQRLQTAQTDYKGQKKDQEGLQVELAKQKANLNSQKAAKASLLAATKNDEAKYQQLLSQAIAQRNAFLSFVTRQGGASILGNQTVCDSWGCYYNQRDGSWGNSFLGTSGYNMANYGCLVTSVAMMASHYGKGIKPNDIANTQSAFYYGTSQNPTAYLYWQFSVNSVNVILNSVSTSQLDQMLASGPVIAGLFSGPDHFIVIKSGSNGNYIMNDPFLENGSNRSLTEKYSVGNITKLFTVSFN